METIKSPAEHRVILHNTSWGTYERLMEERGESRVPRFTYDRGELEIMSPSTEHESIAYYIGLLVAVFAEEAGVDLYGAGSTTFDREDLGRGFEPDACFYVQNAERVRGKPRIDLRLDPQPDLVIEVDITSPSLDKFPIYARASIPEIWRHMVKGWRSSRCAAKSTSMSRRAEPFPLSRAKPSPLLSSKAPH
jgi:Uma2 family endonuclease